MFPIKEKVIPAALPCAKELIACIRNLDQMVNANLESQIVRTDNDVVEYARAFVALRAVKDELDDLQKKVSKIYEDIKSVKLPEKFDQAGVPSITLDEGYRVQVSHRVFASINKDRKEEAYEWLRQNQLADLVTETVNTSTLSAVAKGMAEENKELDPDLFKVTVVPNTSVVSK